MFITDVTTTTVNNASASKRTWIVLDLESAVLDESGHKRYQSMERWTSSDHQPSRRGYKRSEDPLTTPRWVFQTITTASLLQLTESDEGGLSVVRFETLSAPELEERGVLAGVLKLLGEAPRGTEMVTWGGAGHDIPLLGAACMRLGLTLPRDWSWLAFGGRNIRRHVDLQHLITGGLKIKPIHMAEVCAACDIPAKMSVPAFAVARLIMAGEWAKVVEACEGDVISTALLLARWRRLHDGRAEAHAVEDRLVRQVMEHRPERGYVAELKVHRERAFARQLKVANDAAQVLAPLVTDLAA